MEILRTYSGLTNGLSITLNTEQDFKLDLGWQDNMDQFEEEVIDQILNLPENYETIRYIHKSYTSINNVNQHDIWYYFYFLNSGSTYTNGLDYTLTGLTTRENSKQLRQSSKSFFRLDFYKTPNDETPNRTNRKLVFNKNISIPMGERYFYNPIQDYIFVPVFTGNNYRNSENMYFYWFQTDSVLSDSNLSSDVFWMTARYYNGKDGSIVDFTNTGLTMTQETIEERDFYYKVVIDRTDYSYQVYNYNGTTGSIVGKTGTPINFYERRQT